MKIIRRQKGISLLEVVLSLVVISTIIVLAVRYFSIASEHTLIAKASQQVRLVSSASYDWLNAQPQADFSDSGSNEISITKIVDAGLLNENSIVSPWSAQNICVEPAASDPSHITIEMAVNNQTACCYLYNSLKSAMYDTSSGCSCVTNGTVCGAAIPSGFSAFSGEF